MGSYHPLEICAGPACPRCGCRDAEQLPDRVGAKGGWWSGSPDPAWLSQLEAGQPGPRAPVHTWLCRYCRLVYVAATPEPPPAPADDPPPAPSAAEPATAANGRESIPVPASVPADRSASVCPDCGGKVHVSSTRKQFRWLKCAACGRTRKVSR